MIIHKIILKKNATRYDLYIAKTHVHICIFAFLADGGWMLYICTGYCKGHPNQHPGPRK